MILSRFHHDQDGATALEFALLAPAFIAMVLGIVGLGMLFWTQVGLQHGVEMAARCASINTTQCPSGNSTAITTYAAQQTLGLGVPASTFVYSTSYCGNQVAAAYVFQFPALLNLSPLTVTAQACVPA